MDTMTVEVPLDVRDNSETVTDYAYMRHLSSDRGVRTTMQRDESLRVYREFLGHAYTIYSWRDRNPNGQRCRFDMVIRNEDGGIVSLQHTEYFTRVACYQGDWCASYAAHYVVTTGGTLPVSDPVPVCEHHIDVLRKSFADSPVTLHLSEWLLIGQHD